MTELMLTDKVRATLLSLIAYTTDVRVLRRAYALVWLDDGASVPEVAEQLNVSRQSVYNWLERFVTRQTYLSTCVSRMRREVGGP